MANLVQTATNVLPGANADKEMGLALTAITAGAAVYKDPTTGKFGLADANAGSADVRACYGIALTSAGVNQQTVVQRSGQINLGATLGVGVSYYVSDTAGAIMPGADVSVGEFPVFLGIAISTSLLQMPPTGPFNPGVSA